MARKRNERQGGRPAQRRRTRGAIVEAAARLLDGGQAPSVKEIADEANVSRRTVYMYFPKLEQLLIDAALGRLAVVEDVAKAIDESDDVYVRVETLARSLTAASKETLRIGRTLIRLTAEGRTANSPAPRRGYRRTEWIQKALAPIGGLLSKKDLERLVSALSVLLGWEAMIVLRDVRALSPRDETDVITWAATALVKAALSDAEFTRRTRSKRVRVT